jgi:hypothetical protein
MIYVFSIVHALYSLHRLCYISHVTWKTTCSVKGHETWTPFSQIQGAIRTLSQRVLAETRKTVIFSKYQNCIFCGENCQK